VPAAPPAVPGEWRVTFVPYLWMASVKSSVVFSPSVAPTDTINADADVRFTDLVKRLHAAFMGAGEARYGRFSGQTALMFTSLSQGGSRVQSVTGPLGRVEIPVDLGGNLKLKATIWTLTGGYDLFRDDR